MKRPSSCKNGISVSLIVATLLLMAVATVRAGSIVNQSAIVSAPPTGKSINAMSTQQEIPLNAGWNMISSNVRPEYSAMSAVFADIRDDLVLVKNGEGQVYWPALSVDTIVDWDTSDGYQVYMTNPAMLTITGAVIDPAANPIDLGAGWAMIGYFGDASQPVEQAMSTILDELVLLKNAQGKVFWPILGVNEIGSMEIGQGYKVYLANPATLTYPATSSTPVPTSTATPPPATPNAPVDNNNTIPGIIEFEDYDDGGEGVSYHDSDPENLGGAYRSDGVDISTNQDGAGGRYSVGWMSTGEWLKYSVSVAESATYELKIRSNLEDYQESNPTEFQILVDNQFITGNQASSTFQNYYGAFGWQGYATIPRTQDPPIYVDLSAGQHTILVKITQGGGGGLNYMYFRQHSPQPTYESVRYPTPGKGAIYYVAPSGNDSNPGTLGQPWRTLNHAGVTAVAGDTVYVRSGTYRERLIPKWSGDPDNYIIFMAYPGEQPVVDGAGIDVPQNGGLIHIEDLSYVRISGFKITNAGLNNPNPSNGFWSIGIAIDESDYIIIDNNQVENTYSLGISTSMASHHILIEQNTLTATNFGDLDTEVSLGVFWFAHDVEIKSNVLTGSPHEGIGVAAGPYNVKVHQNTVSAGLNESRVGIYIDAWTEDQSNIDVFNNLVKDNPGDGIAVSSEGGGLLENVRIFNNLIVNSGYDFGGIGITNWANTEISNADSHPLKDIFIYNNTLSGAGSGNKIFINNPEIKNVVIKNNIMAGWTCRYESYVTDGVCLENFRSDRCTGSNCDVLRGLIAAELTSSNNLYDSDPRFVNSAQGNYRLVNDSPAIDKAEELIDPVVGVYAPNNDYDGATRPSGPAYDIGAFEYIGP